MIDQLLTCLAFGAAFLTLCALMSDKPRPFQFMWTIVRVAFQRPNTTSYLVFDGRRWKDCAE